MNLREIRKNNEITQKKASDIIGIPLRTYIRYETDEKYQKSFKYKKMYEVLESFFMIDEEHGILKIDEIQKIVEKVFDRYDIDFAFLFGSYAKGCPKPTSDVDIMISTEITGLDYFGLVEELRESLHKKIDLIRLKDIAQDSQLLPEILKVCKKIYG